MASTLDQDILIGLRRMVESLQRDRDVIDTQISALKAAISAFDGPQAVVSQQPPKAQSSVANNDRPVSTVEWVADLIDRMPQRFTSSDVFRAAESDRPGETIDRTYLTKLTARIAADRKYTIVSGNGRNPNTYTKP